MWLSQNSARKQIKRGDVCKPVRCSLSPQGLEKTNQALRVPWLIARGQGHASSQKYRRLWLPDGHCNCTDETCTCADSAPITSLVTHFPGIRNFWPLSTDINGLEIREPAIPESCFARATGGIALHQETRRSGVTAAEQLPQLAPAM